jgi:Tannase-like family of unknown function (DUF6351)
MIRIQAALFACIAVAFAAPPAHSTYQITSLSNRPNMISGGDVLLRVDVPENLPLAQAIVKLNGADVTGSFKPDAAEHALVGLVVGLKNGENRVDVTGGKSPAAHLALTNHPITGPIFSGPQEQPFICTTDKFKLPDGNTLGAPLDTNCSAKTVVNYVYKSTTPIAAAGRGARGAAFKPLPSPTALPADVAYTTTSTGRKTPYIVRVETGTINRAIYQIAILHDPSTESEPSAAAPPKSWNQRLVYTFGGGCTGGWYKQGTSIGLAGGILDDATLAKGYAEASATLNVFGNNCNDLLAAETMMMVKERFIEAYGLPAMTLSEGGSGGSYQQLQISDNYPGLLDGIIPSLTFPDVMATVQILTDLQLLNNYFTKHADSLTESQKLAIAGVAELKNVTVAAGQAGRVNPIVFCPPELPQPLRYDPVSNRKGARCDVFDHTANVYGRDPETGFARRPLDNTGVQYGLAALNAGKINVEQFLDLNQNVGGYDADGNMVAARAIADTQALRAAYRTGRITNGGGGLAAVPIIDSRPYRDQTDAGDFHLKFHSFSLRERLQRANGSTANEVMLSYAAGNTKIAEYALAKMDEWVTKLHADPTVASTTAKTIEKIDRAKPVDLIDSCYGAQGERIRETQTFAGGKCNELYPTFPSPRMVAGGTASNDVLKCQLKPIDFKDYQVAFTDAQKSRLSTIFPTGVCNFAIKGVEQQPLSGSWLTF